MGEWANMNREDTSMPEPRREQRRDMILDGAWALLESGPYSGFTLESLTRSLHISKSTFYKHFATKEAVVASIADGLCHGLEEDLNRAVAGLHRDATPRRLREVSTGVVHAFCNFVDLTPHALWLQRKHLPTQAMARFTLTRVHHEQMWRYVLSSDPQYRPTHAEDMVVGAAAIVAALEAAAESAARRNTPMRGAAVQRVAVLLLPWAGR